MALREWSDNDSPPTERRWMRCEFAVLLAIGVLSLALGVVL